MNCCQVTGDLLARFEEIVWKQGEWPEANLQETMFYLRKSKFCCLPQIWKDVIPRDEAALDSLTHK